MDTQKYNGLRYEPWSTPEVGVNWVELHPLQLTYWTRPSKYDRIIETSVGKKSSKVKLHRKILKSLEKLLFYSLYSMKV